MRRSLSCLLAIGVATVWLLVGRTSHALTRMHSRPPVMAAAISSGTAVPHDVVWRVRPAVSAGADGTTPTQDDDDPAPSAGEAPEPAGDGRPTALPPALRPYFDATLMSAGFWRAARYHRDRVERRWWDSPGQVSQQYRMYVDANISLCSEKAPECSMWLLPPVNSPEGAGARMYRKCCVEHALLCDTLGDMLALLEPNGIQMWLALGSLLGAVRHNGTIIAWDLDADVYVRKTDKRKTYALFEAQGNARHFWNPRRRTALVHTGPTLVHDLPFVELIFWEDEVMGQYGPLVFPLRRCRFCQALALWCPREPAKLLTAWYGRGWATGYRLGRSSHATSKGMGSSQLAKGMHA
eukprot:EG_transcript_15281